MWEKELRIAEEAVESGAKILLGSFGRIHSIRKKGAIDLVTDADILSENVIVEKLKSAFPDDRILTEETDRQGGRSNRTWIIDPLDGTTNFAHTYPFFCVSLALESEGELVLGIVSNPWLEEHFHAVKDKGAYLNDIPLSVSETGDLGEGLIATGFPYDVRERPERVLELFKKMLVKARGIRRAGSAAIDLCYLAAGRLDGFWEMGLKPWDTAAGVVIVKEAGGKLTTFTGGSYSPYEQTIAASNGRLHDQILTALKS